VGGSLLEGRQRSVGEVVNGLRVRHKYEGRGLSCSARRRWNLEGCLRCAGMLRTFLSHADGSRFCFGVAGKPIIRGWSRSGTTTFNNNDALAWAWVWEWEDSYGT
jgi:hypothetical protein